MFICPSTSPLLAVLHSVCIDPMHTNKSPSRPCSPRRPPRRRTPLEPRQRRPSSPPRLPPRGGPGCHHLLGALHGVHTLPTMLLAATPAPAGSRALTSDAAARVGGRCESRRRRGSGAAAWPRCDASRHSRRRGAARLRRRGSGAAGVAAAPAPGRVTPAPSARTTRRRWCPHPATAWRGAGRRSPGGSGSATCGRRRPDGNSSASSGGGGPATVAQGRSPAAEAWRQRLWRGGPRCARPLARARSWAAEARRQQLGELVRGAGRRRRGAALAAAAARTRR